MIQKLSQQKTLLGIPSISEKRVVIRRPWIKETRNARLYKELIKSSA